MKKFIYTFLSISSNKMCHVMLIGKHGTREFYTINFLAEYRQGG